MSNKIALNIYIINAPHLSLRREKVKAVIEFIVDCARKLDYGMILPKIINTYNPNDIQDKVEEYKGRVSHDHVGDEELDKIFDVFSMEMFSNTEKHREAWRYISTSSDSQDTLHLVLEDDAVIMQNNHEALKDMLEYMKSNVNSNDWDIMYWGLAPPVDKSSEPIVLNDVRSFKVLPSKESYFVNRATAGKLFRAWTDGKLNSRLRVQMSKYFYLNRDIKAVFPNRRVTIDGSKLGFFPSSVHGNNVLVFNGEYMQLYKMYLMSDEDVKQKNLLQEARKIYNSANHIKSADLTHIYGVILIKAGKLEEAEELLKTAVTEMQEAQGVLNNRCDLCNNIINLYQKMQNDIDINAVSKYDKSSKTIPLKD